MFTKLARLKRQARRHYTRYQTARNHLDCGASMAECVSLRVAEHKIAFNECMDRISKLDPSCPAGRL